MAAKNAKRNAEAEAALRDYRRDHGSKMTDRFVDLRHITVQFDYPGTQCALWQELDREIYPMKGGYAVVAHVIRKRHKLSKPFSDPCVVLTKWRKVYGLWNRISLVTLPPEAITVFRKFLDRTFAFEDIDMCPRCGRTEHEERPRKKKFCTTCNLEWPRDEPPTTEPTAA